MNTKEIIDLISIREYVNMCSDNNYIDSKTSREIRNMLFAIDKKITDLLKSDDFKSYIEYENIGKIISEVRQSDNPYKK
jgi:hypothetical protein